MAETLAVSGGADNLGDSSRPALHRTIGPFQMTLYGLGSMLGSGVYGLMGQATGLLLLIVFALLNGALCPLKNRDGEPRGRFEIPLFLPILGSLVCAGLVIVRVTTGDWRAPALAGALLAGIFLIYAVLRLKAGMPQGLG